MRIILLFLLVSTASAQNVVTYSTVSGTNLVANPTQVSTTNSSGFPDVVNLLPGTNSLAVAQAVSTNSPVYQQATYTRIGPITPPNALATSGTTTFSPALPGTNYTIQLTITLQTATAWPGTVTFSSLTTTSFQWSSSVAFGLASPGYQITLTQ